MAYDPNNIFAKILRDEAPSFRVYEDDHTLAFMDAMPQADGHTLVIPKFPAENIFELDADYAAHMARTTKKVATAVKAAFEAPGVMIAQLNGSEAGQTVFHIHTHVLPRKGGLQLKLHARDMEKPEVLEKHAAMIRAQLK